MNNWVNFVFEAAAALRPLARVARRMEGAAGAGTRFLWRYGGVARRGVQREGGRGGPRVGMEGADTGGWGGAAPICAPPPSWRTPLPYIATTC